MERSGTVGNGLERSGTVWNGLERSEKVWNGERSGTVNGQECPGMFKSERSKTLERIVENGHGTVTLKRTPKTKELL
jgi:hypothetical protein